MNNKQINHDWTLRDPEKLPRKNNVVIDIEGNLGMIVRTAGDMVQRSIWVENVHGEEVYTEAQSENFTFANKEQSKKFYIEYKKYKGWEIGNVYTLRGKDYPLLLEDFDYDFHRQDMLYVFRDLNVTEIKYVKTLDESLLEFVEDWEKEATIGAFVKDLTCRLDHDIEINIRENDALENGWSVSGQSFSFDSAETANAAIRNWIDRMKVRRVASVLQNAKKGTLSQISLSPEGLLYVAECKVKCGQPAVFVSRVAAALALVFLGEDTWKSALELAFDRYDI